MARPSSRHPTERELEILKLVWEIGSATVRQVCEALSRTASSDPAYTSVMTVMHAMVGKGYLSRKKQGHGYIYRAQIARGSTTDRILQNLIARAFGGVAANVGIGLLKESDLDLSQLLELRMLIDQKIGGSVDESCLA